MIKYIFTRINWASVYRIIWKLKIGRLIWSMWEIRHVEKLHFILKHRKSIDQITPGSLDYFQFYSEEQLRGAKTGGVGLKHRQVAHFLLFLTCPESLIAKLISPPPTCIVEWGVGGDANNKEGNRRKCLSISGLVLALFSPLLLAKWKNSPSIRVESQDQPNDPISTGFCQRDYRNRQQANENEQE